MRHKPLFKALLHRSGRLLALGCVVFVVWSLWQSGQWTLLLTAQAWAGLAVATAFILLANAALAVAWLIQLYFLDSREAVRENARALFAVYAITQFAKYLPGNVFHFAGRYAMGRDRGVSHSALALTTVCEPLMLVLVAGALSAPFLWEWFSPAISESPFILLAAGLGAGAVAGSALAVLIHKKPGTLERIVIFIRSGAGFALAAYLVFVLAGAAALNVFLPDSAFADVMPAAAFAWVLGFVTIGAPAGIGVREAALLFAFAAMGSVVSGEENIIAAVALYRLAAVLGDFVFMGAGLIMQRQTRV